MSLEITSCLLADIDQNQRLFDGKIAFASLTYSMVNGAVSLNIWMIQLNIFLDNGIKMIFFYSIYLFAPLYLGLFWQWANILTLVNKDMPVMGKAEPSTSSLDWFNYLVFLRKDDLLSFRCMPTVVKFLIKLE